MSGSGDENQTLTCLFNFVSLREMKITPETEKQGARRRNRENELLLITFIDYSDYYQKVAKDQFSQNLLNDHCASALRTVPAIHMFVEVAKVSNHSHFQQCEKEHQHQNKDESFFCLFVSLENKSNHIVIE